MTILGVDVAHFQGFPNFAQVKASGREFVVIKATEGTTYTDPNCAANRKAAHAAGLVVGLYHFARAGNATAEAAFFRKTVGALQPGEFLVLDQEVPNSVAWCKTWLDAVRAATGVAPLIYMNQSATTGLGLGNWSTVAADYGLWLAKYDGTTAFPAVPHWGTPAMKQFSDKATVHGIAGTCDVDVFNGTRDQLLAYGYQGADMPLSQDDKNAIEAIAYDAVKNLLVDAASGANKDAAGAVKTLLQPVVEQLTGPQDPDVHTLNSDLRNVLAGQQQTLQQLANGMGKVQAPTVDEAKLAAALLSDPDAVQALGKAIADNLQLSPRAAS